MHNFIQLLDHNTCYHLANQTNQKDTDRYSMHNIDEMLLDLVNQLCLQNCVRTNHGSA
jgi:hypothetical protein